MQVNDAEFIRELTSFTYATGRNVRDVLKQQARLLVRDCMGLTPPTTSAPIADIESYGKQRMVGKKAIANDIKGVFIEPKELGRGGKMSYAKKYLRNGDLDKLRTMFKRMGKPWEVAHAPTKELHFARRGSRGRTLRSRKVYVGPGTVATYQGIREKDQGKAKAGWVVPYRALGGSAPDWIARHSQPGEILMDLENFDGPSITVANLVAWAQKHRVGKTDSIIARALKRRAESMRHQTEKMLGKTFSGYSKK